MFSMLKCLLFKWDLQISKMFLLNCKKNSLAGRIIIDKTNQLEIGSNEFNIKINNLNTGVYMLNVFEKGKHILTRKIIIVR